MRLFSCALALMLAAALPFPAQKDQPKPNTLTPKEIADGWILLFDGETTFGWKIDGEAKVEDGVLVLGGKKATRAETTTPLLWANYAVSMETNWQGESPKLLFFGAMVGLTEDTRSKFRVQALS
jgi:hypothetical protein